MIAYSQALSIPPTLSLLTAAPYSALVTSVVTESLYIPMQPLAYGIHGACYTGKVQVTKWMAQLAQRPLQWQLHIGRQVQAPPPEVPSTNVRDPSIEI